MFSSLHDFFFKLDPQDDVSSPIEYPYLIVLRHSLNVLTSWPLEPTIDPSDTRAVLRRKVWVLIQKAFHVLICVITISSGALYVLLHQKYMTFFEIGHLYISVLMTTVAFSRATTLCLSSEYVAIGKYFLEHYHLFFYKDRSEYWMKTHKQVHRICHIFTVFITGQMIFGLSLFNLIPMYNNYSAGNYASGGLKGNATYEHALYFSSPFPVSTDLKWYIYANISNWIMSYLCSSWFCIHDCFLSIMVFHIWGHFKVLIYNLENFPRPSSKTSFIFENGKEPLTYEMYDTDELEHVSDQLKEIIDYHRIIVDYTGKVSDIFGPMLFVYYGFHQTCGCLLLMECSQMTGGALIRYLPLTIILFQQLIQMSLIFELIGSISDRLKFAVYGLPWECMDAKNRRTVGIFLMNVQEPVHVKALGLADVGVTSMTTILKTSLSYFTFLRSK